MKYQSRPLQKNNIKKGTKSKKTVVIAVVLGLLFFFGVGLYLKNYFYNRPEKVLADTVTNSLMRIVGDVPVNTLGTFEYVSELDQRFKLTITFDSVLTNSKSEANSNIKLDYANQSHTLKADILFTSDDELYIKITNLKQTISEIVNKEPALASYTGAFDPLITKFDNRWIVITKEDLVPKNQVNKESLDSCIAALESLKISNNDRSQVHKLFMKYPFIISSEQMTDQKINDQASFHYKININASTALSFISGLKDIDSFKKVTGSCSFSQQEVARTLNVGDKESVIELWVSKKDRKPTKFKFNSNNKKLTLNFLSNQAENDKYTEVKKPTDAISFREFNNELKKATPNISNL